MTKRAVRVLAAASVALSATTCAHPTRLSAFDYRHRPSGYGWVAHPLPGDGPRRLYEYYGRDPVTHWTVYVGPDGIYYSFAHPPPIEPSDLRAYWHPHNVHPATLTTGSPTTRPTPK